MLLCGLKTNSKNILDSNEKLNSNLHHKVHLFRKYLHTELLIIFLPFYTTGIPHSVEHLDDFVYVPASHHICKQVLHTIL